MKITKVYALFVVTIVTMTCSVAATDFNIADAQRWMWDNGKDPICYLAQKFDNHDIVILGEEHRVHQFTQFVAECIPALHEHGVTVLAMEFENSIVQPLIDSFLALPSMDTKLLHAIRRKDVRSSFAFYKEYIDIFRACWKFNQTLQDSSERFRIVALDLADYDSSVTIQGSERAYARDMHMFGVLQREVLEQGKKALVYCGWMHAMTKMTPPKVTDGVVSKTEHRVRLGNHIWECCRDRAFSIFFYTPYFYFPDSTIGDLNMVVPVDGKIEDVMSGLDNKPVGFDFASSPFETLTSDSAFFRFMKADWTLNDVCDGYLFLCPVSEWQAVSIENIFEGDSLFYSVNGKRHTKSELDGYLKGQAEGVREHVNHWKTNAYETLQRAGNK